MSKKRKLFILASLSVLFLFALSLFFSATKTLTALKQIKVANLKAASLAAKTAIVFPNFISRLSFQKIPDLEIWRSSLELISFGPTLQNDSQRYFTGLAAQNLNSAQVTQLQDRLNETNTLLTFLRTKLASPYSLLGKRNLGKYAKTLEKNSNFVQLLKQHLEGKHKYMIVFQNSEEIRATGGFMGSFALLETNMGQLERLKFYDIYDADGQFKTQIAAPAGVEEYLSGGEGHRLPDANWHPDFPSTSQKIIKFMTAAGFEDIDAVIAVNLGFVEEMLNLTGGIYLPDYGMTVTADNFSSIARADREIFFPGDKSKKQFLENLFHHLKFKLGDYASNNPEQVFSLIDRSLINKNLQFFSSKSQIQNSYEALDISGNLKASDQLIYLVESNVGVNKANRKINRSIKIDFAATTNIEIQYSNNNTDISYINYQRLIINPSWQFLSAKLNGKKIEKIDEQIITNSKGERFKQLGFLVAIPANKETKVQIQIATNKQKEKTLLILKQPGLPATPYTVNNDQKQQSFVLEKDEVLHF